MFWWKMPKQRLKKAGLFIELSLVVQRLDFLRMKGLDINEVYREKQWR
jgi:hypothetical protein